MKLINNIKLLLQGGGHEQEDHDSYDSFLEDLQTSGNKTRPRFEDHALITKIVKMLRGDHIPGNLPKSEAQCDERPVEEGFIDRLHKMKHRDKDKD